MAALSVIYLPSLPSTMPSGVGSPFLASTSIVPRCIMDVAQSITNGNSSSVGIPTVIGFVPSIGSMPKVGAMLGRALVPMMQIRSAFVAMVAQYPAMPKWLEFLIAPMLMPNVFAFLISSVIMRWLATMPMPSCAS